MDTATTTTMRTVKVSRLLAALAMALMLSVLIAQAAGATTKTPVSVGRRNEIQTQNCEDGGGTIEVTNHYGSVTNGHQLHGSSTTCSGGALGGMTCVNTKTTINCTTAFVSTPQGVTGGAAAVQADAVAVEQTPTAGPAIRGVPAQNAGIDRKDGTQP